MIKLKLNSGDLCNRLQVLAKAQSAKNSITILETVKIEVGDNAIMLTAGDDANTVQSCLNVEVLDGKGEAICVRTDTLVTGLRELPNQPITLVANENGTLGIRIDYANGHFTFTGQDAADYPQLVGMANDARHFFLNGEKLRLGVGVCKKFVADDELRPVMCGIFFDLNTANKLAMVASNGHALARKIYDIENTIEPISFNLPLKASTMLTNIINKADEDIEIVVDGNRVQFKTKDYTMISRLIDGKYPNYNSVIPTDNPIAISLPTDTIAGCLRRVLISANDSTSLVSFTLNKGSLLLSAQDEAFGTSSDETVACEYEGDKFAIGLKGTLILDILSVIPSGTVDIKLSNPTRAAVFVPQENAEGEDLTLICMPMMLNA